jgi:hypothetical protein
MFLTAEQAFQIAFTHQLARSVEYEIDASFNALHSDFAADMMRAHFLPREKDHAKYFETVGFVECFCLLMRESLPKRTDVDDLTG